MRRRSLLGIGIVLVVGTASAMEACGGSDGIGELADSEAGALDEASTDKGSDAADAEGDGEAITDGGSNIDPDAGDDLDAGPDGGPCNTVTNDAPAITSVCASVAPVLGGGPLVPGRYFLTHVAALGTSSFCQSKFVPTGFKETLVLTVSAGVGIAETHTVIGNGGSRHRTTMLTPAATNKSPLEADPTCPVAAGAAVPYASAVVAGKQELVLRLAYGTGEALYWFEKQ
jgi:hypothetical protein